MPTTATQSGSLTRRRLLQAGAAGTAVAGLGGFERLEAVASAATAVPPQLRRSTYLALSSPRFDVRAAGERRTLQLVSVDDLADPRLRGRDDAFSLRLQGAGAPLESGIHTLEHADLGRFDLFISPVDDGEPAQDYELLVDRTVSLPGDGASATGADGASGGGAGTPTTATVRVLRASLRRGKGRRLVATVRLDSEVEAVRASLTRGGRVVARALAHPADARLRLRFTPRGDARAGRYALRLVIRDRAGGESYVRHSVRLRRS